MALFAHRADKELALPHNFTGDWESQGKALRHKKKVKSVILEM